MCLQTRPRFIFSYRRVLGYGVRTLSNPKGNIPSTRGSQDGQTRHTASCNLLYRKFTGGSNPRRCIMQSPLPEVYRRVKPATLHHAISCTGGSQEGRTRNAASCNLLYWRFTGGSNPRRCIRPDSETNTLPTELFRPQGLLEHSHIYLWGSPF